MRPSAYTFAQTGTKEDRTCKHGDWVNRGSESAPVSEPGVSSATVDLTSMGLPAAHETWRPGRPPTATAGPVFITAYRARQAGHRTLCAGACSGLPLEAVFTCKVVLHFAVLQEVPCAEIPLDLTTYQESGNQMPFMSAIGLFISIINCKITHTAL